MMQHSKGLGQKNQTVLHSETYFKNVTNNKIHGTHKNTPFISVLDKSLAS